MLLLLPYTYRAKAYVFLKLLALDFPKWNIHEKERSVGLWQSVHLIIVHSVFSKYIRRRLKCMIIDLADSARDKGGD